MPERERFYGKPYYITLEGAEKHNIKRMPPGVYTLLTFVAPFGMRIDVTLNPVAAQPQEYNSTVGMLVVQGRAQNVSVPYGDDTGNLNNITIRYYIPGVFGVDGLAAATVLRYVDGTQPPMPPSPPSPPPMPPAPPPLPANTTRVLVTTDFMVTAQIPVEIATANGVVQTGYYVSIPIKFYGEDVHRAVPRGGLPMWHTLLTAYRTGVLHSQTTVCRALYTCPCWRTKPT